jgi:mannose-6-phosphate isomerase-like protein (cupin superfamily)
VPRLLEAPTRFPDPRGVVIDEHVGAVASGHDHVSVAVLVSPPGWSEPEQTPEFDEITVVLSGRLLVRHAGGVVAVGAGQAVVTWAGETVAYETGDEPAEYVAVCLPAFTPDRAHRVQD